MVFNARLCSADLLSMFMECISGSMVRRSSVEDVSCVFTDSYAQALPFLVRTDLLLAPLLPLFTGYILSLLGFNIAKHVLPMYFGS